MRPDEVYAILKGKIVKLSEKVDGIPTPLTYKGSVSAVENLPASPEIGWMYNISQKSIYGEAGMNVAWTGTEWNSLGPIIDMSPYLTKEDAGKTYQPKGNYLESVPQATESSVGGITAKAKTTESMEAAVDPKTGRIYVPDNHTPVDEGLKNSGEAADAAATGKAIDELKSDLTELNASQLTKLIRLNEYNVNDIGYGYFSDNSNDNITENNGWIYTDYIAIDNTMNYFIYNTRKLKLYDKIKNFLSTVDIINSVYKFESNVYYVRFDSNIKNKDSIIFAIYTGGSFDDSVKYNDVEVILKNPEVLRKSLKKLLDNHSVDFDFLKGLDVFAWNVIDNSKIIWNAIIQRDGSVTSMFHNSIHWVVSDFSKVIPNETLHFAGDLYGYDENKEFVSMIPHTNGVVTIPSNVHYVRTYRTVYKDAYDADHTIINMYCLRSGYGYNYSWDSKVDSEHRFPIFRTEQSKVGFQNYIGVKPFGDKKFGFIGDSFSAPGIWQTEMCDILGAVKVVNKAVSGGSFGQYNGYVSTAYQQAQAIVSGNYELDFIYVFLGINDRGNDCAIGSFVDSNNISDFDLTTYCGGIQACLNYLQNNYPDATIRIGFTPCSNNYTKLDLTPYIDAMKMIAEKYNVQYMDTLSCGVSRLSDVYSDCWEYGVNGGHPKDKGYKYIGKAIAQKTLHG